MKQYLLLAAACLVASFTQAQPIQPDQLRLRVTMQLAADLGVPANSTFNPRFFDGSDYVNQMLP